MESCIEKNIKNLKHNSNKLTDVKNELMMKLGWEYNWHLTIIYETIKPLTKLR